MKDDESCIGGNVISNLFGSSGEINQYISACLSLVGFSTL